MKPFVREILTDLKAAIRIGDPESLYTILEQVRELSEEELPAPALPELGRPFCHLPAKELQSLSRDASPVVRALAAVGMAGQFARNPDFKDKSLGRLAGDKSPEVRRALIQALIQEDPPPEKLAALSENWLHAEKPALQTSGLLLLPAAGLPASAVEDLLSPLADSPDYDLRSALVECLNLLSQHGQAESALRLLTGWSDQEDPNVWVITRALSASWALDHSTRALSILGNLIEKKGPLRAIQRAMSRHDSRR